VSALFLALGNFLGKVRPNFAFGVRTSWSLTSDIAWEKTHRLAGRLFVLAGLGGLVAAIFSPASWMIVIVAGTTIGCVVGSVVASYVYWRAAPDKRRPPERA